MPNDSKEPKVTSELYIGIMSGTSLDAVDAVIASISEDAIELVQTHSRPIPAQLRQQILKVSTDQPTTVSVIGSIDHLLGKLYAETANELLALANVPSSSIKAIGNHGQTVCHQPTGDTPFTIQLGDANLIAALTGINTVADFRRMDMALGGQGAPLVPAFHQFLFPPRDSTTVVLNIGGIANITVIPPNGKVHGYDTGPGNMLMDAWCEQHLKKNFDLNAEWASTGEVNSVLLEQLVTDEYLIKSPPKSTGREYYNLQWLKNHTTGLERPVDIQRTLCEFTALSIVQQVQQYTSGRQCKLLVCGGGARNPLLMQQLQHRLTGWQVFSTSVHGIPVDMMEAMAFAWLARQRMHNQPGNLPAVTGACRQVSLGVFFPMVSHKHQPAQ